MLAILSAFGQVLASLAAAGLLMLAAYAIGSALCRRLRLDLGGTIESATWSITLGLVAGGMAIALAGLLGLLYRPAIAAATAAAAGWGLSILLQRRPRNAAQTENHDAWHDDSATSAPAPPKALRWGMIALALLVGGGSLISALAPPTAGDALCYHLELPKTFLAQHRLSYLPYHDNSTFPLLGEMWLLWGLALDGPVAAQLVAWCFGWLLAGATFILAAPLLGRRWALIAAFAIPLAPAINNHMAAPLVDVPTALLTTLMLAAWLRSRSTSEFHENIDERNDALGARNWTLVAGVLLGAACGVKYVGLVWTAAWCALVAVSLWQKSNQRRQIAVAAATVLVIACSVGGMWYVRAAYYRGNPVYPMLSDWIASSTPPPETVDKTPLPFTPAAFVTAPWQATIEPERFGGRGHRLGAVWLMLLPCLLWTRRLSGLAPLLALAAFYALLWFGLRQNLRFLLPIVPLLAVAAAWCAIELARWPVVWRRLALILLAGVVAVDTLGTLRRSRANVGVALAVQSRNEYLLHHEPTYRAACVANAILPDDARILSQDYRAYYFRPQVTREQVYRRMTRYDQALDGRPLPDALRQRGFTHLLLVESRGGSGIDFDATLSTLVDRAGREDPASARRLACLDQYDFVDADGVVRHYRLIELR